MAGGDGKPGLVALLRSGAAGGARLQDVPVGQERLLRLTEVPFQRARPFHARLGGMRAPLGSNLGESLHGLTMASERPKHLAPAEGCFLRNTRSRLQAGQSIEGQQRRLVVTLVLGQDRRLQQHGPAGLALAVEFRGGLHGLAPLSQVHPCHHLEFPQPRVLGLLGGGGGQG